MTRGRFPQREGSPIPVGSGDAAAVLPTAMRKMLHILIYKFYGTHFIARACNHLPSSVNDAATMST